MSAVWPYIAALIPSAGIGLLFWLVIKNMLEGDRKERLAHSQWDRAQHETFERAPENPGENSPESGHFTESRPAPESSHAKPGN